jgi:hypothetical protein
MVFLRPIVAHVIKKHAAFLSKSKTTTFYDEENFSAELRIEEINYNKLHFKCQRVEM